MDGLETIPRAAFLGKPAWHKLGTVVEKRLPFDEFVTIAKLSYVVTKEPALVLANGVGTIVPNQFHLVRSDDGKVVSPHTVTDRYSETYPSDWAKIVLGGFVEKGYGSWDAAFTLYDGHSEVVSVKYDDVRNPIAPGEESEFFLVGQNYHGTGKVRFKLIRDRVVCHNTVTSGFAGGADMGFSHTASLDAKLAQAAGVWETARVAILSHEAEIAKLVKACNVPATVDALLGIDRANADKIPTRLANKRDSIVSAASTSPGTDGKTYLDIFNGITYLSTHDDRGKGGDTPADRMASILDGARGTNEATMLAKLVTMAS